jgi:NAD(P)-dependent dehydrogenase (short-subunit alcohol dehydrogenase family)
MKTLSGKVIAITGAASGMGRSLAIECARRGADVAIVDVDEPGLQATVASVRAARPSVRVDATKVDCGRREQIYRWAVRVQEKLGGADAIINNAGVSLSASVEKMRDEDFAWLFDINFWGVVHGTRAFLPQLRDKRDAHIVNVSSVYGFIGVPTQSAYCAAKFAVRGFSESLRQELAGSSIHVSCVHPGGIKTEIAKRGRHYEDANGNAIDDMGELARRFDAAARTTADEAAQVILRGVLRNEPRILIGADARLIDTMARLAPRKYDAVVTRVAKAASRRSTRSQP